MRRWALISILSVIAIIGAVWWYVTLVVETAATYYASSAGLRDFELRLQSVGLNSARAVRCGFTLDTDYGPVVFNFTNITARYDLNQGSLQSMAAATGNIEWRPKPITEPARPLPVVLPLLPTLGLTVDHLHAAIVTPLGKLGAPGVLTATTDPAKGLQATLHGQSTRLTAALKADGSRLSLQLEDGSRRPVLAAEIADPFGVDTRVSVDTDLAIIDSWLPQHLRLTAQQHWIDAVEVGSGRLGFVARYDAKNAYWLIPELRAQWRDLGHNDVTSTGSMQLRAAPRDLGWQLKVVNDSFITASGAGLPKTIEALRMNFGAGNSIEFVSTRDDQLTFHGSGPIDYRIDGKAQSVSGKLLNWRFARQGDSLVQLQDIAVHPEWARIRAARITATSTAPWSLDSGGFTLEGLGPRTRKQTAGMDINGTWSFRGNEFAARGTGAIRDTEIVKWRINADPARGAGTAEFTTSTEATAISGIAAGLDPLAASLSIRGGQISGEAKLAWNSSGARGNASAEIQGLDASIFQAQVHGANIRINVTDLINMATGFSVTVPRARAANGLAIQDISVNGSWRDTVITIDEARLATLGGQFRLHPGQLALGEDSKLIVQVSGLALAKIFAMLDLAGLTGSGNLNGEIPVLIHAGGIEIPDSRLTTDGPGVLKYVPGGKDAPPPIDNIALKALRDFRYDTMTVNTNYSRNGDYSVRARLRGHNPELYDGYPIAFNVNLTGNLPGMLRTALLTGDFDKEVLKHIQSEAKKLPQTGNRN